MVFWWKELEIYGKIRLIEFKWSYKHLDELNYCLEYQMRVVDACGSVGVRTIEVEGCKFCKILQTS